MPDSYDGNNVKVGPGTLYAAPLGTAEPADAEAAWGTGWVALGYTDNGSTFSMNPTTAAVTVEEEYYPIRNVVTGMAATMTFALAETTARNLAFALNLGITGDVTAGGIVTAGAGGDLRVEPPPIGSEKRVMLGWDSLGQGAAASSTPFGRIICRQCFQTGSLTRVAQQGANKATYSVEFSLEKPAGLQPFAFIMPAALAGGAVAAP